MRGQCSSTGLTTGVVNATVTADDTCKHMASSESSIGEQEMALLRHIADRGALTVGEAADEFGTERGLARSTVLTMMERLRRKGHLARRMADGIYRYRALVSSTDLLKSAVQRFVERSLDGSVSPFFAYLSEAGELSEKERKDLEKIVARLDASQRKEP